MKRTKLIILGMMASVTLFTTSCSDDFLDVTNPTGEDLNEYYQTKEHIDESLTACYGPLAWYDWDSEAGQYNPLNLMGELQGDNFWAGGELPIGISSNTKLMNYESTAEDAVNGIWIVSYYGVTRCNDLLKYIADAPEALDSKTSANYQAQARVLRAFYYNLLWHYYGNIPYYTESLNMATHTAPQLKANEIYDRVITDLEEALSWNALPMRWSDADAGRVSQAMGYMLFTEMVMYQNDESRLSKALGYMREIIKDPGYELTGDFASLWRTSGEWCEESIFEVNYNDANNERSWSWTRGTGGTVLPQMIGPYGFHTAGYGWDGDSWGFMPLRKEAAAKFSDADARKAATVWDLTGTEYDNRYQDTHLWLDKYKPQNANNAQSSGDIVLNYNNNLRVYRYAETLLNAAELVIRTGGDIAEAKGYVSQVRERAGLNKIGTENDLTIDMVLHERDLELMGEGKRYFDLVRAEGISGVQQNKASVVLKKSTEPVNEWGHTGRTKDWTPNKKYIPIPLSELSSDTNLEQNTEYFN